MPKFSYFGRGTAGSFRADDSRREPVVPNSEVLEYTEIARREGVRLYQVQFKGGSKISQGYRAINDRHEVVVNGPSLTKAIEKLGRQSKLEADFREQESRSSYILHDSRRPIKKRKHKEVKIGQVRYAYPRW